MVTASIIMSLDLYTMVYDGETILSMAPGEGTLPVSILHGTHAEELSFPQMYNGHPRDMNREAHPSPFTIASTEILRRDRRGALPMHILYMAMKVMRYRVANSVNVASRKKKHWMALLVQTMKIRKTSGK
ncbi:MAG TPA: hypothetical protein ACHBX0_09305 [Arsenophonus sp.]